MANADGQRLDPLRIAAEVPSWDELYKDIRRILLLALWTAAVIAALGGLLLSGLYHSVWLLCMTAMVAMAIWFSRKWAFLRAEGRPSTFLAAHRTLRHEY